MSDPNKPNSDEDLMKNIMERFKNLTPEEREVWQRATSSYPPSNEDARFVEERILGTVKKDN